MATNNQCLQCVYFNSDNCDKNGITPDFNQIPCESFKEKGINLDNQGNTLGVETNPVLTENQHVQNEKQALFAHPFSFSGRIRRLEFGLSYILFMVWDLFFSAFVKAGSASGSILFLITFLPGIWFIFAQGVKRCHDRDNSGWYQFIPFYDLWMLFADGDAYENSYGPDPKGRNMFA